MLGRKTRLPSCCIRTAKRIACRLASRRLDGAGKSNGGSSQSPNKLRCACVPPPAPLLSRASSLRLPTIGDHRRLRSVLQLFRVPICSCFRRIIQQPSLPRRAENSQPCRADDRILTEAFRVRFTCLRGACDTQRCLNRSRRRPVDRSDDARWALALLRRAAQ